MTTPAVTGSGKRKLLDQGVDTATAARQFWTFGYDPATGATQVGLYEVRIEQALLGASTVPRHLHGNAGSRRCGGVRVGMVRMDRRETVPPSLVSGCTRPR
jgi:hypothetical protein